VTGIINIQGDKAKSKDKKKDKKEKKDRQTSFRYR
jgi:hypothetical protein